LLPLSLALWLLPSLLPLCASGAAHAAAATSTTAPATRSTLREYAIRHDDVDRRYLLHVPGDLDPARPARATPLVMMLHGAGGSAEHVARAYGWRELADREHFLAVFPEGTRPDLPPATTQRAGTALRNPRLWNDGSGRGPAGRRKVDDIGYLAAVLDDVARRCNVDADRVYCTGFSNGASMTFSAGVQLSDRFAAVAPISGHLWLADPKPKSPRPMFFLTGDADPLNPLAGGEAPSPFGGAPKQKPPIQKSIDAWVTLLGLDPAKPTMIRDDDNVRALRYADEAGDASREVVFYVVNGLGHEWPGRPRVLPRRMTGGASNAVDATALVWEFFKNHPRQPQ
jgi:polyhydroxybutyrate depolymerase